MAHTANLNFQTFGASATQQAEKADAFTARLFNEVSISVYEDLSGLEDEWRNFEQHAEGTVFQTYEWLATYQKHIGVLDSVKPVIVVGRDHQGGMLFLLPLAIQPIKFAKALVWLGSNLCDYNGPLLAPHFATVVTASDFESLWKTIVRQLRSKPSLHYDLVQLEKIPVAIGALVNPMLFLATVPNPNGAYSTPLPANWDEFYAGKRSSDTRRRDRTKRKRLGTFGEVRLFEPADKSAILRTLETLMRQKACSFARMGVSNLFDRPGYADFYRALTTDANTAHLTHASELYVGENSAAVNLGLKFRGRYYHLLASYTDNQNIARFGPGAAHLHDLLRQAIARGFQYFDFTIGDENYKKDWCDGRHELYDCVQPCTLRGAFIVLPIVGKQRIERLIKQTPFLWAAFSKTRSISAQLTRKLTTAAGLSNAAAGSE